MPDPSQSQSRRALDRDLARHPAIGSEPKDGYVLGRIHPHRVRLSGVAMQARIAAKAMTRNDNPAKLLIFGRPRSGTTLLVHLLNQLDGMRCDGELLHDFIPAPLRLLRDLPKRAGARAYGVKLLSYQMTEVQKIRLPLAFFDAVVAQGYTILHLRRGTWAQTLSLAKAQGSGVYFVERAKSVPDSIDLDPARFVESLAWNERMLAFEDAVMAHVPHIRVDYETGLKDSGVQQATIDRVADALGLARGPVTAQIARTGGDDGRVKLGNLDALLAAATQAGLSHLLPAPR
jgi:hypothetical protein